MQKLLSPSFGNFLLRHARLLLLGVCCGFAVGCQAPGYYETEDRGFNLNRLKFWDRSDDRMMSTDGIRGPLERILGDKARRRTESLAPLEGSPEFDEAKAIFQQGDYDTAEKRFKKLAKAYKDTPIEEDSLFMTGECQFITGRYAKAQDSYGKLLKKYPSPRDLDLVTKRLFHISKHWLEFPDVVTSSEVQTVSWEDPKSTPPPENPHPRSKDPSRLVPILPNLWDHSRPVFDTDGRALEALRMIWMNDPTGPLADDAIMLTASYHLRKGDFLEADRNYTILREQYPKSPHLENAFVLGSHVKLMSYQGAMYEGDSLEAAHQLKESTLRLYPKHPQRERLLDEVRKIEEAKAEREWANVVFWQKKNKPQSVATCCREVIRLYPNSSYAAQARQILADMQAGQQ
ncbi:MAG: outer membrane protein assembly factor BamD [Planctomycetaceae bacterium]|nr:outer membrane protein assembly factor BamD [Planctomycetaceae bacterium]